MAKSKPDAILVFGENENDRESLIEIAKALAPQAKVRYEARHKPLMLVTKRERAQTVRQTANDVQKLVIAARIRFNVIGVIAHRDCDAVETAHLSVAIQLKEGLKSVGIQHIIAAAPAFELEAWWFLFPDAVQEVCPSWERLPNTGGNIGMIVDAKERLSRLLRPKDSTRRKVITQGVQTRVGA